uniref:hypothetical protein n=1 Tax=Vibrio cholerae TaxID=666 RepID=UPI00301D1CC5
ATIGLLPGTLFAAEPALPGPLQALRETLRRPLPTRFTAKSRLTWPGGVVSGQYEYRGSPERCVIRGSLISVGRLQGAPN